MNSESMPNTPTNMLESTGGVPVASAATYVAKSQFSRKYTRIPVSESTVPGSVNLSKTENPKDLTLANFNFAR